MVNGDIRDAELVASLLKPDVVGVVHLAAVSRVLPCLDDVDRCWDVNVRGTKAVLDGIRRADSAAWMVHTSSREVYGSVGAEPVREESPKVPVNEYGKSKLASEVEVQNAIARRGPLRAIILRLSSVYGGIHDIPDRLVPAFVRAALGDQPLQIVGGHQDLDLLYIDDCVDGFIAAVSRLEKMRTQTCDRWRSMNYLDDFNLVSGENTLASDLIDKVMRYTASASPVQQIGSDDRFPSRFAGVPDKSATELGFKAKVGIDQGLQKYIGQYRRRFLKWAQAFVDERCSGAREPDRLNSEIDLLDGCSVNLAFRAGQTLFQVERRGDELFADGRTADSGQNALSRDAVELKTSIRNNHLKFSDQDGRSLHLHGSKLWLSDHAESWFRVEVSKRSAHV